MSNFFKYNKLNLYKEGLNKFINIQINQENKWNKSKKNLTTELTDIEYIIGILFLTEMNRNCKNNGISIHGYYITSALINLFNNIKKKLLNGKKISSESIVLIFNNISTNIEYLNSRVDTSNPIRKKINENLSNLILEISPLINEIIYYKKEHSLKINNDNILDEIICNNSGLCNKNCYNCWVDEILTKFIYILLIIAKFMGTGNSKEPNLYKLAEYYANIIFIYLKLENIDEKQQYKDEYYKNLYTNYQDYKSKLIYSNLELDINSDTIDEIIAFLDNIIIKKFLEKNNKNL